MYVEERRANTCSPQETSANTCYVCRRKKRKHLLTPLLVIFVLCPCSSEPQENYCEYSGANTYWNKKIEFQVHKIVCAQRPESTQDAVARNQHIPKFRQIHTGETFK